MEKEDIIIFNKYSNIPLDPRTKIFLTLTVSTILVAGGTTGLMGFICPLLAMIPFILLLSSKKYKPAILFLCTYSLLFLMEILVVPKLGGVVVFVLMAIIAIFSHMLPGFLMGYFLITSTSVSEFVSAMERMRISQKIVIPISVIFRFLPTIKEEYTSIGEAMRMRNIMTIRKPFQMIEYRVIPLMMSIVKIGDELSASALTRGLGSNKKRTNICEIGFGILDFMMIGIGAISWVIFLFF